MPAPLPGSYGVRQPSCFDRMKYGFMVGFCVGLASGALFGGFSALRMLVSNCAARGFVKHSCWNGTKLLVCLICCVTSIIFKVWLERQGVDTNCWQNNDTRWRDIRDIHGHRNWNQVLMQ